MPSPYRRSHAKRFTTMLVTALVAGLSFSAAAAAAEAPVWRTVDREFSEFIIKADRRIVRDPRLAFILADRLRSAEKQVAEEDEFTREERSKHPDFAANKGSREESLYLLGSTSRYAAVMVRGGMCAVGAHRCNSGDFASIYRLSDRKEFKRVDALELGAQSGLWRRLIERDAKAELSEFGKRCDDGHDSCGTLLDLLNLEPEYFTPEKLEHKIAGVGFSTGVIGRVKTLDVHISDDSNGGHDRAYRWPIDTATAAPLLKPAIRNDLLAAAEGPKPAISFKSKSVELSVTIEDALKAHPGLYDNLLAEGKREAAKWRADADQARARKEAPFTQGGYYELNRSYTQRSAIGRYVSVLRGDATFTGGAHPNSHTDTILWDRTARKQISIRPFFREMATNGPTLTALAKLVRAAVHAEKKARDRPVEDDPQTDSSLEGIKPDLLKIGPVTLAPSSEPGKSSGLTFHYSPYMVGPYAEGGLTAFVPWTTFKELLSGEGIALFGGERPEDDASGLD
jgi:hypothetical protein